VGESNSAQADRSRNRLQASLCTCMLSFACPAFNNNKPEAISCGGASQSHTPASDVAPVTVNHRPRLHPERRAFLRLPLAPPSPVGWCAIAKPISGPAASAKAATVVSSTSYCSKSYPRAAPLPPGIFESPQQKRPTSLAARGTGCLSRASIPETTMQYLLSAAV
jgi:hypothetical protein